MDCFEDRTVIFTRPTINTWFPFLVIQLSKLENEEFRQWTLKSNNDKMIRIIPFWDRYFILKDVIRCGRKLTRTISFQWLFLSLFFRELKMMTCLLVVSRGLLHHFSVTFDGGWAIVKSILCLGGDQKTNLDKIFNRSQFSTNAPSADSQETLHFLFFATKYKCKYLSCHLLLERQGYFPGFFIHFT